MHFHIKADRPARMGFVAGNAFALVVESLVHILLNSAVDVAAGIDRQAVAASGKDIPMRVVTFTAEGKILPQDA